MLASRKRYSFTLSLLVIVAVVAVPKLGLGADGQRRLQNAPSGTGWAMQAMAALTGGNQVNSVAESGSVTRTVGNDQEAGTITLQSTGIMTNQITISTNAGNRSETRSWDSGMPSGEWTGLDGQPHQMAQQNCWTDAVWFFPRCHYCLITPIPTSCSPTSDRCSIAEVMPSTSGYIDI